MIIKTVYDVMKEEAYAILKQKPDTNIKKAVEILARTKGKVVVMGVGKSGIIGEKFASSLSSTGTPAIFLHPADAIHGDLGVIEKKDTVFIISFSGGTSELKQVLPYLRSRNIPIILLTGTKTSYIKKYASCVVNISIDKEACPLNLAPTTSTTVMLAVCDGVVVSLMKLKKIDKKKFAELHPGGMLGKKLLMKVKDIMRTGSDIPVVKKNCKVKDALLEMTRAKLGSTCIIENGKLAGYFTDGDLRRNLEVYGEKLLNMNINEVMTENPLSVSPDMLVSEVAYIFKERKIDNIPVVKNGRVIGIIDERDIIEEGFL